jgi:hypothetical protein
MFFFLKLPKGYFKELSIQDTPTVITHMDKGSEGIRYGLADKALTTASPTSGI